MLYASHLRPFCVTNLLLSIECHVMKTAQKSSKKLGPGYYDWIKVRQSSKIRECKNYADTSSDGNIPLFPARPVFPYEHQASCRDVVRNVQNDCKTENSCAQWHSNVSECDVQNDNGKQNDCKTENSCAQWHSNVSECDVQNASTGPIHNVALAGMSRKPEVPGLYSLNRFNQKWIK